MSKQTTAPEELGLTISNCVLQYRHQQVFDNFELVLKAGQWTSLLGRSGVGKTSLLQIILGLLTPEHVTIQCTDQQPLNNRASYMAQQDLLMPWLSVLENCLLGYKLRKQTITHQRKSQALALLERVGLVQAATLKPEQLSGGMRQRVALVRTLLENKPIILMDEPFSALDIVLKLELHALARELLVGKTVLFITHDPAEAIRLSDQAYVLYGTPARLSAPVCFAGKAPREPTETVFHEQYAELFHLIKQEV